MSCQTLHIVQRENRQTKKAHFEALASGDGKLEGANFYAQADEISFDQSKGQFVLRSRAPRRVTLWRQEQLGSNRGGTDAQSIEIIPALKFFKLNGTTGVDGAR